MITTIKLTGWKGGIETRGDTAMPTYASADLTFQAAVKAFNLDANGNQDVATLKGTLHDGVIICKISDGSQAAPHGVDTVLQYLTSPAPGLKGCKFTPDPNPKHKHVTQTKIDGLAAWVDNDGSSNDTLKYSFDFHSDNFLITKFFAGDK